MAFTVHTTDCDQFNEMYKSRSYINTVQIVSLSIKCIWNWRDSVCKVEGWVKGNYFLYKNIGLSFNFWQNSRVDGLVTSLSLGGAVGKRNTSYNWFFSFNLHLKRPIICCFSCWCCLKHKCSCRLWNKVYLLLFVIPSRIRIFIVQCSTMLLLSVDPYTA